MVFNIHQQVGGKRDHVNHPMTTMDLTFFLLESIKSMSKSISSGIIILLSVNLTITDRIGKILSD